ncbi:hypothetical protein [Streptomyces bullii]|uniref:Uncharacterized protein n=1 Tax=Streptomyces bullii TaxID=349910 RepID=A0ABW0V145_9ACTN
MTTGGSGSRHHARDPQGGAPDEATGTPKIMLLIVLPGGFNGVLLIAAGVRWGAVRRPEESAQVA